MKILLTYFEPFGGKTTNTTMKVSEYINGVDKILLPVSYERAVKELLVGYNKYKPDYIISLGEAQRSGKIEIEKFAHNIKGASLPDNDGVLVENELITEGPLALTPNKDIFEITKTLQNEGYPVIVSHTAGGFICNLVMYNTLTLKENGLLKDAAFIHLPHLDDESDKKIEVISETINKFIDYFTKS